MGNDGLAAGGRGWRAPWPLAAAMAELAVMLGGLSMRSREALAQLCSANGIREEDLQKPERITNLEMVLDDYNVMDTLRIFTHLRSVCLIQQAIMCIEGLDACPFLERLVLNENCITKVENLGSCSRLRQLHLSSNRITELGNGLQGLHDLEVFWIAENLLTSLHGIELAPNLEELNVARNRLDTVVGQLDRNVKVRWLNLADNQITSFRDILDLSKFVGMTELALADPDWGENPICDLSNYQMYTLYHLPSLRVLDRMRISDEEHSAAQAAFARKRLFYSMRIKVAKRHAADTVRFCQGLHEEQAGGVRHELEAAARALRRISSRQLAKDLNPSAAQISEGEELLDVTDQKGAERRLRDAQAELADLELLTGALRQGIREDVDRYIRGLRLELQTGGNVRLEAGLWGRDIWAKQVSDLVCARFRAEDFSRFGIMDIKVQQVTRVHSRSNRIRFEGILKVLESEGIATNVEYLFYVPDVRRASAHLKAVAEEGEGTAQCPAGEYEGDLSPVGPGLGQETRPLVLVTNSVGLAEAGRLDHFARTPSGQAISRAMRRGAARRRRLNGSFSPPRSPALPRATGAGVGHGTGPLASTPVTAAREGDGLPSAPVVCSGSLLLCSCYLGEQRVDEPSTFDPGRASDLRSFWLRTPSLLQAQAVVAAQEAERAADEGAKAQCLDAGLFSLYRTSAADGKQGVWQVSDPRIVLPEYLVEFDYVYSSEFVQANVEDRKTEFGSFARYAREFAFATKVACVPSAGDGGRGEANRSDGGDEAEASREARHGGAAPGGAAMRGRLAESAPDVPQVEYLNAASLQSLQHRILGSSDRHVLTDVKVLNLHGRGLRRLDPDTFESLPKLEILILSFNCISSFSAVAGCTSLTHLDVSFNLIEKVSTQVESLKNLRVLDLSWNSLGLTSEVCDADAALRDTIRTLARDAPRLESLDMTGNPLTACQWYKQFTLASLPSLRTLDEHEVAEPEVQTARKQMAQFDGLELSESLLMERAFMRTAGVRRPASELDGPESERNRIALLLGAIPGGGGSSPSVTRPTGLTKSNWRGHTERMDLRDLGFGELCRMSGFSHLRRLDLSGNRLTSLLRLSPCVALEELAVEHNLLRSLEGAGDLPELRRLDAGSNRISDVLELKKLAKLNQLSLEDNLVDSLDTFAPLHSLIELYLSNNLLEELRSVLLLKQLPKLLVLDLSGNELCSAADSRLYSLFHLRRVKVFNGLPVTPAETQAAEEKFSGKVTMELLEDKLGPSPSCYNFRSVDLSNQNLKELGQLLNDDVFPSLRELCLNGNPFSDIRTVGPLSKLLVLKMNRTKIDLEKGALADADQMGGFASMPHLQVLEIGHSGICDMSYFAQFPLSTLRILHLPGNEITRTEGLSQMEQLRELVLDKNKIKQIDEGSLDGLRSLRELRMDDNGLKSLSNFGPLPRLRALHLSSNRIGELTELEKLRGLRHVVIINLSQNPVARKPLYRAHLINVVCSARAVDGKEVTEEERERVEQMLQGGSGQPMGAAGCYVFTEQQAIPTQVTCATYMHPASGEGGAQRGAGGGQDGDAGKAGVTGSARRASAHVIGSPADAEASDARGRRASYGRQPTVPRSGR